MGADILWARQMDMQKNVHRNWDQNLTVKTAMTFLKSQSRMEIELDLEEAERLGLSLDSKLPAFIEGYGITLRSIEQMLLRPSGLAVEPSADGKSLVLTKNTRSQEPLSHFQELHRAELEERIATLADKPTKIEVDESTETGSSEPEEALAASDSKTEESDTDDTPAAKNVAPSKKDKIDLQKAVKGIASSFNLLMGKRKRSRPSQGSIRR